MGGIRRGTAIRRAAGGRGCFAHKLRAMHGMLSAAILICVFAAVTAACLYATGRVYLAGTRRGHDPAPAQDGVPGQDGR
jgi:hypothetical protein